MVFGGPDAQWGPDNWYSPLANRELSTLYTSLYNILPHTIDTR